jgi:hypothetical protein
VKLDEPHTLTRRDHPDTSHAAAEAIRLRTGTARHRVMEMIALTLPWGISDEEMQTQLAMSPNTQRPRRVELVRAGYVKDSGERTVTQTGARSILWIATAAGVEALAESGL